MTNETISSLEEKIEETGIKNEHAISIAESLHDMIRTISNTNTEYQAIEFNRLSTRLENMFNILDDLLQDSKKLNHESSFDLLQMNKAVCKI